MFTSGALNSRGVRRMKARFTIDASGMRRLEREELARIAAAGRGAVERVTKRAERFVETATKAAIPGRQRPSRLHLAWGSQIIQRAGEAYNLFGLIRPNGRRDSRSWKTLESYAKGAKIRGRMGQSLAIPTENAGMKQTGRGKIPLVPKEWERRTHRKLRLVAPRGEPFALLVADDVLVNRSGAARAATGRRRAKYRQQGRSLVIFVLVREVEVMKRLSLRAWIRPFRQELKLEFLKIMDDYDRGVFFGGV